MRLIILAAGKGERLWPLTKDTPKPLVNLGGGKTLLEEQLGRVKQSGVVDDVVVVTGYLGSQVDEVVAELTDSTMKVSTVYNPFYGCSNNLASLWIAREMMTDDFMVTNGDNLFDVGVFGDFKKAAERDGIYLSLGRKDTFDDDDMKVTLSNGLVTHVAKDIPRAASDAESPGLCLVKGVEARRAFVESLDGLMRTSVGLDAFWLRVFTALGDHGYPVRPWFFDTESLWREVDIHPDVDQMKAFLSKMAHLE